MRIFVSSSFEDLREHRAAAIRVLRQLGHQVLAMEDIVAGSTAPLLKVLDDLDRAEAYVGIFAWRYGYVPKVRDGSPSSDKVPEVAGAVFGETSITHYEYLRALERDLPVLVFLLDERFAWQPKLIDGFDPNPPPAAAANIDKIRTLRERLQQERVVSWFTTPTDLEARVSAAVTTMGITRQLDLQPATALDPQAGAPGDTSAELGITSAIVSAGDRRALKFDLLTEWWSTRLYLIAALAERLTQARRILVVDSSPVSTPTPTAPPPSPVPPHPPTERLIGQLSTSSILSVIGPRTLQLESFATAVQARPRDYGDLHSELADLLSAWYAAFGDQVGQHNNEQAARVQLNRDVLRRWFGDAMLEEPVRIADLQRASVVDVLRLLDYPNELIPVLTHDSSNEPSGPAVERIDVMDKLALNARLARSYVLELMDRARIT